MQIQIINRLRATPARVHSIPSAGLVWTARMHHSASTPTPTITTCLLDFFVGQYFKCCHIGITSVGMLDGIIKFSSVFAFTAQKKSVALRIRMPENSFFRRFWGFGSLEHGVYPSHLESNPGALETIFFHGIGRGFK